MDMPKVLDQLERDGLVTMSKEAFAMLCYRIEGIEQKLDSLIASLAEDQDDDEPEVSLDGTTLSRARDESQPL